MLLGGPMACSAAQPPFLAPSTEILGALVSVLSIWVVTGVLVYLAVQRLLSGEYEIEADAMLITSACAVAVNIMYVQPSGRAWSGSLGKPHKVEIRVGLFTRSAEAGASGTCWARGTRLHLPACLHCFSP